MLANLGNKQILRKCAKRGNRIYFRWAWQASRTLVLVFSIEGQQKFQRNQ